jgi:hypothetical protein
MTDNIFSPAAPEATPPAVTDVTPAPTNSSAEDQLLKAIVNEQGAPKYSSVPDALKALAAAQEHIRRLEADNAALRDNVAKAKSMEELVAALKPAEAANTPAPKTPAVDIGSEIDRILQEKQKETERKSNQVAVAEAMKEAYGEKASELFYTKAQELGFSKQAINELAANNPKAVITLFGVSKSTKPNVKIPGIRTEGLDQESSPPVKSGMAFGSTRDLVDSWRAAGEKVKKQLS